MSRGMADRNSFLLVHRAARRKSIGLRLEAAMSSGYTPLTGHGGYWQNRS